MGYVLDYYFVYGLFRLVYLLSCLAKIAVLFSTGCSQSGIPPLSLRGLLEEYFSIISTYLAFWPSFNLHVQHISVQNWVVLQGCSSGGEKSPFYELVLHWRKDSIHWECYQKIRPYRLLIKPIFWLRLSLLNLRGLSQGFMIFDRNVDG